jgi:hypothetical protein
MILYLAFLGSNLAILNATRPKASYLVCGRRLGIPEMSRLSLRYPRDMEVRKMVLMNHPWLYIFSSWGATAFDDLPATEVVVALTIQIDEGTGVLGASTFRQVVTMGKPGGTSPAQC